MRRRAAEKRVIPPDMKYHREDVSRFIHKIMQRIAVPEKALQAHVKVAAGGS